MGQTNKNKCRKIVIIELALAFITLVLMIFLIIIENVFKEENMGIFGHWIDNKSQIMESIVLQTIFLFHFATLVMLLFAGYNVLKNASSLTLTESNWDRLNNGVQACNFFCNLEALRMVLIVAMFMGELTVFNLTILFELIRNIFNVPVVFGWYFVSEFQKELETRRDAFENSGCVYTVHESNHIDANSNEQSGSTVNILPNGRNYDLVQDDYLGTFLNTSPGVAYFLSSSNVVR